MIRNCLVCGKEFKTYPCKVKVGKGKYCSKGCSYSVTLIKKGQNLSRATQFKKGMAVPEEIKLRWKGREPWNKNTKGLCKPNRSSWKKGQRVSIKTEFKPGHGMNKLSEHPNWLGGKSYEPYPLGWTRTFKEQVRRRDEYKCQICYIPEIEYGKRLDVHHIDYNKENLSIDNLISLCKSCHSKTNFNRKHWGDFFNTLKGGVAHALE